MLIIDNEKHLKNRNQFNARSAAVLGFSKFGRNITFALNDKMKVNFKKIKKFLNKHKNEKIIIFGFTFIIWENFYKHLKNLFHKIRVKDFMSLTENLKNLNKQLSKIKIESIKKDKSKNLINDKKIGKICIREQVLKDLPPKELRAIIDQGKKEIKSGIVIAVSIFDNKLAVAVGISDDLTSKYNAVDLVKIASQVLGGKGGGGRKDFAQAGGVDKEKIEKVFTELSKNIN